jgi:glycolate oxidase FAD binding subunit
MSQSIEIMDNDSSAQIVDTVHNSYQKRTPLQITGGGSHPYSTPLDACTPLHLSEHSGVIEYYPAELTITLRAGTPLLHLKQLLAAERQMLAFEPPIFEENSTIGGAIAAASAGAARPWQGGVRDHLLGVKIITGEGKVLQFGGRVVKNVAGYDLFRPMAGAYGTLGVLLEVTLKVLPMNEAIETWQQPSSLVEANSLMSKIRDSSLPVNGLCWHAEQLSLRLSASETELTACRPLIKEIAPSLQLQVVDKFWEQVNDRKIALFNKTHRIIRLSLPAETAHLNISGVEDSAWLLDWGGAQRWISAIENTPSDKQLSSIVSEIGGWHEIDGVSEIPQALLPLHKKLKSILDPANILNPKKLSPQL